MRVHSLQFTLLGGQPLLNKTPAQAFNPPAITKNFGVERLSRPTPLAREYFHLARLDRVFQRDFAKRASPFVQINARKVY